MKTPLKVKTSRENGAQSRSASPSKTKSGSSGKGKGKAKEIEINEAECRPGSQLKAGWKLQPIDITASFSRPKSKVKDVLAPATLSPKKRAKSPAPRSPAHQLKKSRPSTTAAVKLATIEILSDSDEDEIRELQSPPTASTSRIKVEQAEALESSRRVSVKAPLQAATTQPSSIRSTGKRKHAPVIELDLDDIGGDLEEDETFLKPATSMEAAITFLDDEILLDGDDDWEDMERIRMRRTESRDASEFGESMLGEDMDDAGSLLYGEDRGVESDDDILELMEQNGDGSIGAGKRRRLSDVSSADSKNLLRPLSSLRRSISPSASTSKVTLDTRPNAFAAIMQGNSMDKKWAEAEESEKATSKRGFVRPAPFYKVLEGMTIAVDAFKYGKIPGVEAYFLSHAHSDHYTNLSSSWANGPIYCSVGTANLIRYKLGVKDEWLHPLPFDETFVIAGVKVTLIDANHCPGSSIFVFEGPHTSPNAAFYKKPNKMFRYLHCGDFRASPAHLHHPALKDKRVDICYLDTTYLNPKYCFPAQEQVVDACAELVKARVEGDRNALMKGSGGGAQLVRQGEMMKGWLSKAKKEELEESELNDGFLDEADDKKVAVKDEKPEKPRERLLVMIGTYSIGKERIVKGIARAIGAKVYADKRKKEIFGCQDDPELMSMLTDDPLEGQIHVTWLGQIKVDELSDYLDKYKPHFTHIVGLRPTGWTFKPEGNMALTLKNPSVIQMISKELQRRYNPSWMTPTKDSTKIVEAYGVPYSEHSSFAELTCFAVSFDCQRFIPTVNIGSKTSRAKMAVWFDKWAAERKRRQAAGEPLMVPHRTMNYW